MAQISTQDYLEQNNSQPRYASLLGTEQFTTMLTQALQSLQGFRKAAKEFGIFEKSLKIKKRRMLTTSHDFSVAGLFLS